MPLNEFLKRLLGFGADVSTCRRIMRPASYQAAYRKWVENGVYLSWAPLFHKAYHYQKASLPTALRVQPLDELHRHGATLFYDPSIGSKNFDFLFEFLKDQALPLGYRLHSSDKHEMRHDRYAEQIEKYYLMPPASDMPGSSLCNQLYGSIMLDYVKVNKHPGYIRVVASTFPDPNFSEPLPFSELLAKLLCAGEAKSV